MRQRLRTVRKRQQGPERSGKNRREERTGQRIVEIGCDRTPHRYHRGINQMRDGEGQGKEERREDEGKKPRQPTERGRATKTRSKAGAQRREQTTNKEGGERRTKGTGRRVHH